MIAFTIPLFIVVLLTSQYINAYPSGSSIGKKNIYPTNLRLKRDFGVLQHHDLINRFNDDIPLNFEENLPFIYSIIPRQNRKRLIDF
jgi:hypothetical protein